MARSTVYRVLRRAGLTARSRPDDPAKDRRRFSYRDPGQLFMSDFMHGPKVGYDPADRRRRRKAFLLAFIDDATRFVPQPPTRWRGRPANCRTTGSAFTFGESAAHFLPVFKTLLIRAGCPDRLYVDNGAVYGSRQLARICASLGISLIHSRPYAPQGKGKIERFFRTVRGQLLAGLGPDGTRSLEALNQRLGAWLEGEYYRTPHQGLGDGSAPADRWTLDSPSLRQVGPETDLNTLFLQPVSRKVYNDRTVRFQGRASTRSTPPWSGSASSCCTIPPPPRTAPCACSSRGATPAAPRWSTPTPTPSRAASGPPSGRPPDPAEEPAEDPAEEPAEEPAEPAIALRKIPRKDR